jgi:hypothetical protein
MPTASAADLVDFLSEASPNERDELLVVAERILDQHPFGCTDEDMAEIGAAIERIRTNRLNAG